MSIGNDGVDLVAQYVNTQEEALFARNIGGQLIRVVDVTTEDFQRDVSLTIDGQQVVVKKAVPQLDAQGIIVRDQNGQPLPRPTTIFDAASQLFVRSPSDRNPIPTLCHREHLKPVGVCRVCMVEAAEIDPLRGRAKRALVPSCTYRVSEGMVVNTSASQSDPAAARRIVDAVRVLVELLATEHLSSEQLQQLAEGEGALEHNELKELVSRFQVEQGRFRPSRLAGLRGQDHSSEMISVNHDACILCRRCERACADVKHNEVIGRSGKGYASQIAFDLNSPMLESSCVSCGECAISCPTDALTFRPEVVARQVSKLEELVRDEGTGEGQILTAEDMASIPIFAEIPFKFLQFNGGACVRRVLQPGEILCREGDYGSTAFLIQRGKFEVFLKSTRSSVKTKRAKGILGRLGALTTFFSATESVAGKRKDASAVLSGGGRLFRTAEDVILGEMTCMNRYPRSATVVAVEESEVIEIRRNVLYMLQRNRASREILDRVYRQRALNSQLENMALFQILDEEGRSTAARLLAQRADLLRIEPGQMIFEEGDTGTDVFLVRLGYVKVSTKFGAGEQVLNYVGPGGFFGEIGALSALGEELTTQLSAAGYQPGVRTANCSALDHVELVRIQANDLRQLLQEYPSLRNSLIERANELLRLDVERKQRIDATTSGFLEQGLFNAQSLLVLDLEACTRCDECTRACADTHEGVTRLIREGLRFDRFLVASSCRSCLDPYCLVGCPVDAIHREGSMEIRIEDHCIGCGLCASNCPYGNINMHGHVVSSLQQDGRKVAVIQQKATTCDLCRDAGGTPSCVYACPHDAAFRMSGQQLRKLTEISAPVVDRTLAR